MSSPPIRARTPVLATAVLGIALGFAGPASAQQGPFGALAGSWSGSGRLGLGSGDTEPIRCRANYKTGQGGATVVLQLRCASDSYKFELHGNVRYQDGRVRGDWSESTRGAAGQVFGTVNGEQIDVRVESQTFSALLTVTTKGDRQSISIKAPSGSQMSEASITLKRS
jgi:hypothetical protein